MGKNTSIRRSKSKVGEQGNIAAEEQSKKTLVKQQSYMDSKKLSTDDSANEGTNLIVKERRSKKKNDNQTMDERTINDGKQRKKDCDGKHKEGVVKKVKEIHRDHSQRQEVESSKALVASTLKRKKEKDHENECKVKKQKRKIENNIHFKRGLFLVSSTNKKKNSQMKSARKKYERGKSIKFDDKPAVENSDYEQHTDDRKQSKSEAVEKKLEKFAKEASKVESRKLVEQCETHITEYEEQTDDEEQSERDYDDYTLNVKNKPKRDSGKSENFIVTSDGEDPDYEEETADGTQNESEDYVNNVDEYDFNPNEVRIPKRIMYEVGKKNVKRKNQSKDGEDNEKKRIRMEIENVKMLRTRTSPNQVFKLVQQLLTHENKKMAVIKMGFERLLDLKIDVIPASLGFWIVDNFDEENMSLTLDGKEIMITRETVNLILGFPIGTKEIIEQRVKTNDNVVTEFKKQFKKIAARTIQPPMLVERMFDEEVTDREFKLNFLVLIATILCNGMKAGTVNLRFLTCITDLENVENYDWSGYVVKYLKEKKSEWKKRKADYFCGSLTFLTLLYVEYLKGSNGCFGIDQPAIKFCTTKFLRNIEADCMKKKQFGLSIPGYIFETEAEDEVKKDSVFQLLDGITSVNLTSRLRSALDVIKPVIEGMIIDFEDGSTNSTDTSGFLTIKEEVELFFRDTYLKMKNMRESSSDIIETENLQMIPVSEFLLESNPLSVEDSQKKVSDVNQMIPVSEFLLESNPLSVEYSQKKVSDVNQRTLGSLELLMQQYDITSSHYVDEESYSLNDNNNNSMNQGLSEDEAAQKNRKSFEESREAVSHFFGKKSAIQVNDLLEETQITPSSTMLDVEIEVNHVEGLAQKNDVFHQNIDSKGAEEKIDEEQVEEVKDIFENSSTAQVKELLEEHHISSSKTTVDGSNENSTFAGSGDVVKTGQNCIGFARFATGNAFKTFDPVMDSHMIPESYKRRKIDGTIDLKLWPSPNSSVPSVSTFGSSQPNDHSKEINTEGSDKVCGNSSSMKTSGQRMQEAKGTKNIEDAEREIIKEDMISEKDADLMENQFEGKSEGNEKGGEERDEGNEEGTEEEGENEDERKEQGSKKGCEEGYEGKEEGNKGGVQKRDGVKEAINKEGGKEGDEIKGVEEGEKGKEANAELKTPSDMLHEESNVVQPLPAALDRPKRNQKPSAILLSPYFLREVCISSRLESDEKKLSDCIFSARLHDKDIIFETRSMVAERRVFESLMSGFTVSRVAIDVWCQLLNYEEKLRSKTNVTRLFCGTHMMDSRIVSLVKKDFYSSYAEFIRMMSNLLSTTEHKSLKTVDLVFFPMMVRSVNTNSNDHFFVICYNLKAAEIHIIDNCLPEDTPVDKRYGKLPETLRLLFSNYLILEGHIHALVFSSANHRRLRLSWQTTKNFVDSGVFAMRHLEVYKGNGSMGFNSLLLNEGDAQKRQLDSLRVKYLTKMLTSDLNLKKPRVDQEVKEYNKLPSFEKQKLKKEAASRIEHRLKTVGFL